MQRLDDLTADRQAKTGMLAELFAVRPLRIKPVEDMFQVGLRNAGPLILDADFAPTEPASFTRTRMRPLWRAEGMRVADQVAQHLHEPVLDRQHTACPPAAR